MLKISNLYLSISGHGILNGVELEVKSGEQVGLIGPNGSGKTTLFNAVSGFFEPQRGSIDFLGKELLELSPAKRANLGVGRVFQNFGIFRELTVLENVLLALEARAGRYAVPWGEQARRRKDEAHQSLERVGLASKAGSKAGSLSGGQMRLLEISRVLLSGAKLLLLDEPTAGVSPKMKSEIETLLRSLRDHGKTCIVIEHDITFIQRVCDRIVVLDSGKVVLDGTPETVRRDSHLQEIYFGGQTNEP